MAKCEEVVQALESKVENYEKLLKEFLDSRKDLGVVLAGPIKEGGITYFRVELNGSSNLVKYAGKNSIFDKELVIEIGSEVVVIEGSIVGVIPNELKVKREKTDFKLIAWDQIGGLKSQLTEIQNAVELPLKNEKIYKEFGLTPLKGILLHGPPGCGKTLIGKAIASTVLNSNEGDSECFVYIKGAELLSPYVGQTEISIGNIFRSARDYFKRTGKRAVIFIDEAEAILPMRGSRKSSDVDATIVPTFLSEMDGLEDGNPLMILSTNLPDNLDEAVLRDGRIDLKIEIKRPTQEDAVDIFNIHLSKTKCDQKHLQKLSMTASELLYSKGTKKISGAMIETIVKKATQKAIIRSISLGKKSPIIEEDLLSVI